MLFFCYCWQRDCYAIFALQSGHSKHAVEILNLESNHVSCDTFN